MARTPLDPRSILYLAVALPLLGAASDASATTRCGTPSPTLATLGVEDYVRLDDTAREPGDGRDARAREPSARASIGRGPLDESLADRHDPRRLRLLRLAYLRDALRTASLEGLSGERVRCRGSGRGAREVAWRFDLEQLERVELLSGDTLLTAYEARHSVRTGPLGRAVGDDRLVADTLVAEIVGLPAPDAWRPSEDGGSLRANRRFRRAGAATESCALVSRPSLSFPELASPALGTLASNRCHHLAEIDTTARAVGGAIELEQVLYVNGRWSERVLWRLGS